MDESPTNIEAPSPEPAAGRLRHDAELRGRIAELERRVAHLTAALAAADRENEVNRARIVQLRESVSWRLTRPLRRLRRIASRVGR